MYVLDGKRLPYDVSFTVGDNTYPANWLRLSTSEQRSALGITEVHVPAPVRYDQRFFWGPSNPKEIDDTAILDESGGVTGTATGLRTLWINKQKETAKMLLASTDWYITRKSETEEPIPDAVVSQRASIRGICDQREGQITRCETTEELADLLTGSALAQWPEV